MSKQCGV